MSVPAPPVALGEGGRPETLRVFGRLPWLSLSVGLGAALLFCADAQTGPALEWSRVGLGRGELWRAVTGHFVHWSSSHLFWDLGVFIAACALLEGHGRRALAGLWVVAGLAISLGLFWIEPDLDRYRGLSGLDSAVYAAAGVLLFEAARRGRDRGGLWLAGAFGVAFIAKLVGEGLLGQSLFASTPAGVVPVAPAHALGAAVGLTWAVVRAARARVGAPSPSRRRRLYSRACAWVRSGSRSAVRRAPSTVCASSPSNRCRRCPTRRACSPSSAPTS